MRAPLDQAETIRQSLEKAQAQLDGIQGLLEQEPPNLADTRTWLEWVDMTRAGLAETSGKLVKAGFADVWDEAETFRQEIARVLDLVEVIDNELVELFNSLDGHRVTLEQTA